MTLMTQKIMLFVVINDLSLTFVISTLHLDFYRMTCVFLKKVD